MAQITPRPGTLIPAQPGVELPAQSSSLVTPDGQQGARWPVARSTGEPVRPLTVGFAGLAAAVTVIVLLVAGTLIWLQSVDDVFHAARVIEWINPEMSSWQALISPWLCLAIMMLVGLPAAVSGYYAWEGYHRPRWGATFAALVSPMLYLLTWVAMLAIIPVVIEAVLLWSRPSRAYADAQTQRRARRWQAERHEVPEQIIYGPLPRFRRVDD